MRLAWLICAGLGITGLALPAAAKKLDKPICDDLKVEQGLLQQKGVPADFAKGPDWAKANASKDRLKDIERLIHVEEQLAFRCPQPKKPLAPGEDEDGNLTAVPAKGAKGTAQAKAAAPAARQKPAPATTETGAQPAAPPKKAAKPAAPAEQPAREASAAPAAPKPAPKPKVKVDDAYSPAASGLPKPSPFPGN